MKLDIILHDIEGEGYLCIKLADLTVLKRKRKTFTPPTIEEVAEYCKERRNQVNVNQWMAHYESNGWLVGRNKMKDWKAAVRTWEGSPFSVVESKGSNLGAPPPKDYGVRSKTAVEMPDSLRKKIKNIGKP